MSFGGTPGNDLFHTVRLAKILGTEGVGAAPTISDAGTDTTIVLVLGQNRPVGTLLLARLINGLWVARPRTVSGSGITLCPMTINLTDGCTGNPIGGAEILAGTGAAGRIPGGHLGYTDASGNYTFPAGSFGFFCLVWDGYTACGLMNMGMSRWNCGRVYTFCYAHAKLTLTTDAAADFGGLLLCPTGRDGSFCYYPASVPPFTPGTSNVRIQSIDYCAAGFSQLLPARGCVTAQYNTPAFPGGHIPNCASFTLNCGDDLSVNVPLYDFTGGYWGYDPYCDTGCGPNLNGQGLLCDGATVGAGPAHRGVFPLTLHATFGTGSTAFNCLNAGTLGGVGITLNWDATARQWDSGCLPNDIHVDIGPYYRIQCARSTRVTISPVNASGQTDGRWTVYFTSYFNADCTGDDNTGSLLCSCATYSWELPRCSLTDPVNITADPGGGRFFTITQ